MSTTEEKVAALETKVFNQETIIDELREQSHKFDIELTKLIGTLTSVGRSQDELKDQVKEYMGREDRVVKNIYGRLNSMDAELKKSFKSRDEKITNLRIDQAKMLAYATAAFAVITVVVQVVMRFV